MNNTIFLCLLAVFFCASLSPQSLFSQQFESTFGSLANHEDAQDGKPIPNGKYIVLSNTLSYGQASRILLTRLNTLGSVEMYATLNDPANPTVGYFGRSIALDLSVSGAHTGYFITGCRTGANGRQTILLRTNLDGVFTWAKVLPANDNTGSLDECGVSVERQSNGDVTVTGTAFSATTNTHHFTLSRFTSAGGQLWSNRYKSTTGQGFEATEACNGFRSDVAVVAVTGRFRLNGEMNHRTFLSCINATTGVEIWRRTYNSTQTRDEGLDVVYKPLTTNSSGAVESPAFMVVGSALQQVHPVMWVVRANPLNGVASSKVYLPGGFSSGFLAEAVSLDVTGTKAAITGRVITQFPPTLISGTFAMVLPFFGTELPDWTFHYSSSSPMNPNVNTHSIAPVTGASAGYFIVCGTRLTGSAFNDAHGIRVNSLGSNGNGCPTTALTPSRTLMGTSQAVSFLKMAHTWTNFTLTRTLQSFKQEFCTAPFDDDAGDRTNDLIGEVSAPGLFPNPVRSGQNLMLTFDSPEMGLVQVRVFDLTGREVWLFSKTLGEGPQQLELPASQWSNGAYFLQLQTANQQKTLKFIISSH